MRWWGWGEDGHEVRAARARREALLRDELGADPARRHAPVELDEVRLPEPALPDAARASAWPRRWAPSTCATTARRASSTPRASSYPDLVRLRAGDATSAPDAVVLPGSADAGARRCSPPAPRRGVAVVPFGGGTSVVGGVEPLGDGFAGAVSLDLRGLDGVLDVDRASLTATLERGAAAARRPSGAWRARA